MKRIFTLLFLSFILFFVAKAQNVVIPDSLFKQALLQNELINTNADNEIQLSEAEAFADVLNLKNKGITDLTGIEAFENINYLIVDNNELNFLDVSSNLKITGLNCRGNKIETLIIGNNTSLTSLSAYDNKITSIDLSQLINLETLRISDNNIAVLDLSNNTNLTTISVENCGLKRLNIKNGNNAIVNYFYASDNPQLTCVTVDDIDFSIENWTEIDPGLEFSTDCFAYNINFIITDGENPVQDAIVTSKDIFEMNAVSDAAGIAVIGDVRKKEYLYKIEAEGYKGVVGKVLVDVPEVNVEVELVSGDPEVINIPDEAFKNYLLSNVEINTNNDSIIYRTEAEYFNGKIDVEYLGINDLSGIEAFTNITALYCDRNSIDTLNLISNIMLEDVSCDYCKIDSLILGNNSLLTRLLCFGNNIKGLNLLGLSSLSTIRCGNNKIVSLDLSQNTQLTTFDASDNSLVSIDIRNGNNTAVSSFYVTGNSNLNCVNVDDVVFATANWTAIDEQVIFSTDCSAAFDVSFVVNDGIDPVPNVHFKFDGVYYETNENGVVEVEGVERGDHIISIVAESFNSIVDTIEITEQSTIDITLMAGKPDILYIPDYNFRTYLLSVDTINVNADYEIQLSEAEAFAGVIDVDGKNITDLTGIEAFNNISYLYVANNNLNFLDVSNNLNLTGLNCRRNKIETLTIGNNTNLTSLSAYDNSITSIDLSQLINLESLHIGDNNIAVLDLSNNSKLTTINVENCGLESLNIKNGNNTIVNYFYASDNPQLTCVTVDDIDYSIENWTDIDEGLSFSLKCGGSSDASLASILVDNVEIEGFNVANFEYEIEVVAGNELLPVVVATASDATAMVEITQVESIPGTAIIDVVSENGLATSQYVVHISVTTGLTDLNAIKVNVYPNPASDHLTIYSEDKLDDIILYNVIGEVIAELEPELKQHNISHLEPGIYYLKVSRDEKISCLKFVKSRK